MHLLKLIFAVYLHLGIVEPMDEQHDDRDMYVLYLDEARCRVVEHVYKEEIYRYIQTGEFMYDEDYMKPQKDGQ
jgi:hypothetical protein